VYESFAGEDGGDDKRYAKIKQVPKERVVGTLEGNWRGEIRWKKAGETVRRRSSLSPLLTTSSASTSGARRLVVHAESTDALHPRSQTSTTLVDLLPLAVAPKTVAPLDEQDELETRRVWAPVIDALLKKDFSTASREKQRIEQVQRDKAEERKKKGETCVPLSPSLSSLALPDERNADYMYPISTQLRASLLPARAGGRLGVGRSAGPERCRS